MGCVESSNGGFCNMGVFAEIPVTYPGPKRGHARRVQCAGFPGCIATGGGIEHGGCVSVLFFIDTLIDRPGAVSELQRKRTGHHPMYRLINVSCGLGG